MTARLLDPLPLIGHYRALGYYIDGNMEAGHKAMFEATRSSAVLGGAYLGIFLGTAGMVMFAGLGGAITDLLCSFLADEPKGVILGICSIALNIEQGTPPFRSIISTGMVICTDMFGGIVMQYLIYLWETRIRIRPSHDLKLNLSMY